MDDSSILSINPSLTAVETRPAKLDERRWQSAVQYFRQRGGVIFLSYCRFWEKHGFVQQSLAYALAREGVPVTWFDGEGWRPYRPVISTPIPGLRVCQLPALPGRRFTPVDALDLARKGSVLRDEMKRMGGNPVIWVQAGCDDRLALEVPEVDVFSVFDDPYRHSPVGDLCQRAKVIVCQTPFAASVIEGTLGEKVHVMLPPMQMPGAKTGTEVFDAQAELDLPAGFPTSIFGYIGAFFSTGFDLELFEDFVRSFPDRGFLLMGRTDPVGLRALERLKRYPNFVSFSWADRRLVAAAWKKLSLCLLFYRPNRGQDGAFPVKVLESLYFGVPSIGTRVPKTSGLEGVCPRSPFGEQLKMLVPSALTQSPSHLQHLYERFSLEMDPRFHLSQVASWLA